MGRNLKTSLAELHGKSYWGAPGASSPSRMQIWYFEQICTANAVSGLRFRKQLWVWYTDLNVSDFSFIDTIYHFRQFSCLHRDIQCSWIRGVSFSVTLLVRYLLMLAEEWALRTSPSMVLFSQILSRSGPHSLCCPWFTFHPHTFCFRHTAQHV